MAAASREALLAEVTVIVVTYNSAHCVEPLAAGLAGVPNVTVVDNASEDDTIAKVGELLPAAKVIPFYRNMGYGTANNRGIAEARTRYVLLLNPDCEITPDQIASLVAGARQWSGAGIWVPQLIDGAGREEINYSWPREAWTPRTGGAEGPLSVGYACAAVMLIDRERMSEVGYFDPRFFLYYEDEDLCLRAFEAGREVMVLPDIRVVHLSRGSVRGPRPLAAEYWRGWHHAQSKVIFAMKHQGIDAGERLRKRTLWGAVAQLPLRAVVFSPRLLARLWGRLQGMRQMRSGARPETPVS